MRLTCPYCGERDLREFSYKGSADYASRPDADAAPAAWDDYLHLRENPAGPTEELWHHTPCGTWVKATRDTRTHAFQGTVAAAGDKA